MRQQAKVYPYIKKTKMAAVTVGKAAAPSLKVAITGAVGNIGYALAFMIGQGNAFGLSQPVTLHLVVSDNTSDPSVHDQNLGLCTGSPRDGTKT